MPNRNCSSPTVNGLRTVLCLLVLALPAAIAAETALGEKLDGYYAREGNNGSPAKTAGNNIYLKFFEDRWVAMLFIPYPYATDLDPERIEQALKNARAQSQSAAYLRGRFTVLEESATAQIERYGYLDDRIAFECGALSACTLEMGEAELKLIKPGVINPHIIRYHHVETD